MRTLPAPKALAIAAFALIAVAHGCGEDTLDPPVPTTIAVSPGSLTLTSLGQSEKMVAQVTDQYGKGYSGQISWESDSPELFSVDGAGTVTAVANGTGTVTANFQTLTATASVTVRQAPAAIVAVAGNGQSAPPTGRLADSLVVRVVDLGGAPAPGLSVSFHAGQGGSVTPESITTDAKGLARAEWTLGEESGGQRLKVSVAGGLEFEFAATALTPNERANGIEVDGGSDQGGRPDRTLPEPISVRIADHQGHPVEGATVNFVAAAGHGSTDPASAQSDSSGVAQSTWTLGSATGEQSLAVSIPGGPSTRVTATGLTPDQLVDSIVIVSGAGQRAPVGETLADSIVVRVVDSRGEFVAGATITFAPANDHGTADPASSVSNAAGQAQTAWTLGSSPGDQTLVVSAANGASVPVLANAFSANERVARLLVVSGNRQTGRPEQELSRPIVVRALDTNGANVAGATVTFSPVAEQGSVEPSSTTTQGDGTAQTRWTTGPRLGTQRLEIAVPGGPTAVVTATVEREQTNRPPELERTIPQTVMRVNSGGGQITLTAHFEDPEGHVLTFGVGRNGETVATARVQGEILVLSPVAEGIVSLTVTATDIGGLSRDATFQVVVLPEADPSAYNVNIVFTSGATSSHQSAFVRAAARWEEVITGNLAPILISSAGCGNGSPQLFGATDDVVILARIVPIDGPGRVLGRAGPCLVRSNFLTVSGSMTFDIADMDQLERTGGLETVILHEMGHVLGIGTLWRARGFLRNPSLPNNQGADTHFSGPLAIAAFDEVGGTSYTGGAKVPVENMARAGSGDSHWRDNVFLRELMSPFHRGGTTPMSLVTVQSMADLGYVVDVGAADLYTLPSADAKLVTEEKPIPYGDDIRVGPIRMVNKLGEIIRILRH